MHNTQLRMFWAWVYGLRSSMQLPSVKTDRSIVTLQERASTISVASIRVAPRTAHSQLRVRDPTVCTLIQTIVKAAECQMPSNINCKERALAEILEQLAQNNNVTLKERIGCTAAVFGLFTSSGISDYKRLKVLSWDGVTFFNSHEEV
jgi:hypothetical protein